MDIIYEDANIVVINKPAGMLTHRVANLSSSPAVSDWLVEHYPPAASVGDSPALRPGIVHRLDRDTSGVLLLAKTQVAFDFFKRQFQERTIKKTYLAVVKGEVKPASGEINLPIGIKSGTTKRSVHSSKMSRDALTAYRLKKVFSRDGDPFSLLEIFPKTGRTHQIRVHLSAIGHPVVGDPLYGHRGSHRELLLHAYALEGVNLDGINFHFSASPPPSFRAFLTHNL